MPADSEKQLGIALDSTAVYNKRRMGNAERIA